MGGMETGTIHHAPSKFMELRAHLGETLFHLPCHSPIACAFFQVAGRGTKEIAKLKPKDTVTVWGPLGTHFAVENKPTLLLAGGIGIAPFAGYVEQHPVQNQLSMFFSHRLPEQYYPVESLTRHIEVETRYEQKQEDLTGTIQTIRQKMEETAKKRLGFSLRSHAFFENRLEKRS